MCETFGERDREGETGVLLPNKTGNLPSLTRPFLSKQLQHQLMLTVGGSHSPSFFNPRDFSYFLGIQMMDLKGCYGLSVLLGVLQ